MLIELTILILFKRNKKLGAVAYVKELFDVIKNLTLYIISYGIKKVFYLPIKLISNWRWNNGLCRKCQSDKYECYHYDSDTLLSSKYKCRKCSDKFGTPIHYEPIADKDLVGLLRNTQLNKLGI